MERDWTLLLPELVQAISERITSMSDYVHFRGVCVPWRSSSSPHPRHLPPQFPALMVRRNNDPQSSLFSFYYRSMSQFKSREINLPEISGKIIVGSSHGWLVVESGHEVSLFNPITRATISLPSPFDDPTISELAKTDGAICLKHDSERVHRAILSSNPSLNSDCVIVAKFTSIWDLGFCRVGGERWTILSLKNWRDFTWDFVCQNYMLYSIQGSGRLTTYNLCNLSKKFIYTHQLDYEYGLNGDCTYLVKESDRLLLVRQHMDDSRVFMLSDNGQQWSRVTDIGNKMLFIQQYLRCGSFACDNLQLGELERKQICYPIDEYDYLSIELGTLGSETRQVSNFMLCVFNGGTPLWLTPSLI